MASVDRVRAQTIERFWETVPPLWGMIRSRIRASAAADFGITVEQFHVLRYVRGGMESMSELASAKNISLPAISQAVDVLVQKGLVKRSHSKEDRRHVQLSLTHEGEALLDALFRRTKSWMSERMACMTADELETIARAMGSLKKMLPDQS
jgi:DNA-binding MarR family transcriptional regulator